MKEAKGKKHIINVTRPVFPSFLEIKPYLERMQSSRVLTNCGEIHEEFETAICKFLGVKYVSLMSSGTLALVLALKSQNLKGEVITTPFTSVSTAQSLIWNNLTPVFTDICKLDFNIDVDLIEKAITDKTSAILPVHVYGNPCKIEKIEKIAQKHKLKVIYDAAHCFGVKINDKSICSFGDLSVLSFHATKVFNTLEGGAVICHNRETKNYLDALKNSGISSETSLAGYGLNAKLNEFQAAIGHIQLKNIESCIQKRKTIVKSFRQLLTGINGLTFLSDFENVKHNYSYFPIVIDAGEFGISRDQLVEKLQFENIFPRRYFYPLVTDFDEFSCFKKQNVSVAEEISKKVICLPLSDSLSKNETNFIVKTIIKSR